MPLSAAQLAHLVSAEPLQVLATPQSAGQSLQVHLAELLQQVVLVMPRSGHLKVAGSPSESQSLAVTLRSAPHRAACMLQQSTHHNRVSASCRQRWHSRCTSVLQCSIPLHCGRTLRCSTTPREIGLLTISFLCNLAMLLVQTQAASQALAQLPRVQMHRGLQYRMHRSAAPPVGFRMPPSEAQLEDLSRVIRQF